MNETIIKRYPSLSTDVFHYLHSHSLKGIPKILRVEPVDGEWETEEEKIEGRTLHEHLCLHTFDSFEAARVCMELCDILSPLHAAGIVHGDIKPENVILTETGEVYLIDFNASHIVRSGNGRDTVLLGTPGYASPEQYGFVRSDFRADIYALGQLLNILITGSFTQFVLPKHPIQRIIKECVQIDPKNRFQSVQALRRELAKFADRKHIYRPALPPGFRTGYPWKMVIAVLCYIPMLLVPMWLHYEEGATETDVSLWLWRVYLWIAGIITVFIFMDYQRNNEWFRLAKKNYACKVIVKILESVVFQLLAVILILVLHSVLGD